MLSHFPSWRLLLPLFALTTLLLAGCSSGASLRDASPQAAILPGGAYSRAASADANDAVCPAASGDWAVFGDSITFLAFGKHFGQPDSVRKSFSQVLNTGLPGYLPYMYDFGAPARTSTWGARNLAPLLSKYPQVHYWGLAFGVNDAHFSISDARYRANLLAMIGMVRAHGDIAVLPTASYAPELGTGGLAEVQTYNDVIASLINDGQAIAGPDLWGWFRVHGDEIGPDRLHPNSAGQAAINRLWGFAAAVALRQTCDMPPLASG